MKHKYYGWAEHTAGKSVVNDPTDMWETEVVAENQDEAAAQVATEFATHVNAWQDEHPEIVLWDSWWDSQTTIASRTPYPDYTP